MKPCPANFRQRAEYNLGQDVNQSAGEYWLQSGNLCQAHTHWQVYRCAISKWDLFTGQITDSYIRGVRVCVFIQQCHDKLTWRILLFVCRISVARNEHPRNIQKAEITVYSHVCTEWHRKVVSFLQIHLQMSTDSVLTKVKCSIHVYFILFSAAFESTHHGTFKRMIAIQLT